MNGEMLTSPILERTNLLGITMSEKKKPTAKDVVKDLLNDDAFWAGLGEKAAAKRQAEEAEHRAFLGSPTCQSMVEILLSEPRNSRFDSESFAYNPEYVKRCMRWEAFDDETILQFIRAVGDSSLDTVRDRRVIDDVVTFTQMGVDVSIMSGQGTIYGFSNASVVRKRMVEEGLLPPGVSAEELQLKLQAAAGQDCSQNREQLVQLRDAINQFLGGGIDSLFTYSIPSQFATEGTMPTVALSMEDMTLRNVH